MRKKKKSKLWLLAFILLVISISPILIDQQKLIFAKSKEMSLIKEKIAAEAKINQQLINQKKLLKSDKDKYTEKIAREKFGMIKPGEKVFVDVNK